KIAQSKLGGRNRINRHQITLIEQGQFLLSRANDDVVFGVRGGAGRYHHDDCAREDPADERADSHPRLKRKNSSAVWVVASATSARGRPRAAAIVSATIRVCAGSQRFPRKGT